MKARISFFLAVWVASSATGATLRPSPVVPSGFVDTESVSNAAILAEALADARTFSGSITIDATVSNTSFNQTKSQYNETT